MIPCPSADNWLMGANDVRRRRAAAGREPPDQWSSGRVVTLFVLYLSGVGVGCLIWTPGSTDYPYHWEIRLVASLCFGVAASIAAARIQRQKWSLWSAVTAFGGAITWVSTILFQIVLAGGVD
jgi:hypothetical protein